MDLRLIFLELEIKMFSSLRISGTILATVSIVFLSNLLAEAQDVRFPSFPKRSSFPSDFFFGAGSSALQIEGAAHEGGRGPNVFLDVDKFSTQIEHYKRYKEDVQHLKKLGINSYRMSISWSRIMPDGTLKGGINQEGVDFYNHLIDELLANGITPFVTILHFDFPLALQQNLGGFLNHSIVKHYKDYSELLFKTYGDRVKHWSTINEVEVTALFNYMHSFDKVPAEPCQITRECKQAYVVLHNYLLAHAAATHLYKKKFQAAQRGEIGLVLSSQSFVPYSSKPEDVAASKRSMDFYLGWVVEPVVRGHYPKIMRKLVGDRLPRFTKKQRKMIKGSADFIGINYYASHFSKYEPNKTNINLADNYDSLASSQEFNAEGKTLGYLDKFGGAYVYPEGLYDVLLHLKRKYKNPKIYITENGIGSMNLTNPLIDNHRIQYIAAHLNYIKAAIDKGVNVNGYFIWAAFDTFEFQAGYLKRWGLYHIDFKGNLKRQPTAAAEWYKNFLRS
ncbi:beta-glucosidase 24-like [Lotus japonicus]|uniref:beta-glucosidase 24-like n=1 Tax=Lotus japonicus TaxID=34305 RepID=UPI002584AC2B|nr:beta-glucosidase 24-like [Lotus japonicus]